MNGRSDLAGSPGLAGRAATFESPERVAVG